MICLLHPLAFFFTILILGSLFIFLPNVSNLSFFNFYSPLKNNFFITVFIIKLFYVYFRTRHYENSLHIYKYTNTVFIIQTVL